MHYLHRISQHKTSLIQNKHHNFHLQKAFNKYGVKYFEFDILEEYPIELLNSMENYWINMLNSSNRKYGYNLNPPNGKGGFNMLSETKSRIRIKRKNYKVSEETKEKLRKANLGKKLTDDQLLKLKIGGINYRSTESYKIHMKNRKEIIGRRIILYNLLSNTWEKFESIADASVKLKCSDGGLHDCIDKPSRSVKKHLVFSEDKFNPEIIYKKQKRRNGRGKYKVRLE